MNIFINFLPILLFVTLYVGSGIYFSIQGHPSAFYQLSPLVAIIPAIILGWVLYKGKTEEKMNQFLDGIRHKDIITMCIIFLLAGAFSEVTKSIVSVDSTVNLAIDLIPAKFLLVGIFITAAFISTAIGTSMGTIATLAPVAAVLATQGAFDTAIGMATVVGGAMFGDSLSMISDTTIAAVMSQKADYRKKLKINVIVAGIAGAITGIILLILQENTAQIIPKEYSITLISPYLFLLVLALSGINVFVVLVLSIIFAGIIGSFIVNYSIFDLSKDITTGFSSMNEIMLLSLMVGGLSGLAGKSSKELADYLSKIIARHGNYKLAQFAIAKIVSVFDILLANNTVAIIFSGKIAKDIAKKYHIPAHYSAAWLDIFSCVFQGIIPYGAQILLASTIAGISPLAIVPHVYLCYILAAVAIIFIAVKKKNISV
jgi:Na+/H+ antiporter NhaC